MTSQNDQAYHSQRAEDELACGDGAVSAAISAIHYELAYRHSLLAARMVRGTPILTLVPGGMNQAAIEGLQRHLRSA